MKSLLKLFTVLLTVLFAAQQQWVASAATLFLVGNLLSQQTGQLCVTLTSGEILMDVLAAFKQSLPGIHRMGTDFRGDSLKLNQTYTAHIPTLPTATDVTTTYDTGTNSARGLLVDVPITINKHKAVPLYWSHFDAIKDQKLKYDQCISNAAYVLGKSVIDDLFSGVTTANFSQSITYAEADCDSDMLIAATGALNLQKALPNGRTMFLNTPASSVLSKDQLMASRDYAGQLVGGNGHRTWNNTQGFAEIIEYPDFPLNNGTAFTITGVASTDVITTSAAHGLAVGDVVTVPTCTGGSGITASATTRLYVKTVPSSTTLTLSATAALSATLDFTTNITDGTLQATENLVGFGFDMRAFSLMMGIPDNFDQQYLAGLNIPRSMGFEAVTDPESGITMAAVSWQEVGTGKLIWAPTIVWGKSLGRQAYSNAAGSKCDYAGLRVIKA